MDCEFAVETMTHAIQASRGVSGNERNLIEGGFMAESKMRVVANSNDVCGTSIETKTELEVSSTIGIGEDQCSSWEIQDSRSLADIDPEYTGEKSAQNALELRGAQTMENGDMPLILTPRALWAILGNGFAKALDAKQVQDGKSYLMDSIGSQIASTELEIADNGILDGGLGSRTFDVEGTPSQYTSLIDSGILRNYLHDSYSSRKDGIESTGNANRGSYRSTESIGPTNLVVKPGSSTLDEMISEMKKGVLCTFTLDTPNLVTGELSAMVMEGFYISKGEIQYPLKSTLFGTSMRDLLEKTIIVGSEVVSWEEIVSPPLFVESVKITSG
jgi:PmbA protein